MTTIIILLIICGLPATLFICTTKGDGSFAVTLSKITSIFYLLFSLLFILNYFKLIQIL